MLNNILWGIDLGGTKTELVILSWPEQQEIFRHRLETERNKGYSHILSRIKELIDFARIRTGLVPDRIGFGTPGCLERVTGLMKNCNTTELNGMPLKMDLEKKLNLSVRIENDANCFALAETRMGVIPQKVPHAQVVWGLILGTGVGSGIVVNQHLHTGLHGIAGEWGHNFLDSSGGNCYCGRKGCVETVISGKALETYYQQKAGVAKTLKEIVAATGTRQDPMADRTIERLLTGFGKAVAQVINILDPDAIVIGGGVGNIAQLYTSGRKEIQKHLFNPDLNTPILLPLLGDSAGVFGAALLNLE
ncbi:MAG: ROK family protein [Marinifilaceae bacterium]